MKKLITTDQFLNEVERAKNVPAVLFTQAIGNCPNCHYARFVINKNQDKINIPIYEMPVTADMYPATHLKIKSVPALVVFNDLGKEVCSLTRITPEILEKEYLTALHPNY